MTDRLKNIQWLELIINALMVIIPLGALIFSGFVQIKTEQAVFAAKLDTVLVEQKDMKTKIGELLQVKSEVAALTDRVKKIEEYDFGKMQQKIIHNTENYKQLRLDFYREVQQRKLAHPTINSSSWG
jgi:hypothetical protein